MPKIRLTNRSLIYIYDRFDVSGKNRRKRLHKSEITEVSEGSLRMLTKRGIRFDIVDAKPETPVKEEVKTEVVVETEVKTEVKPVIEAEEQNLVEEAKKKVTKKKKKKTKKQTKAKG